MFVEGLSFYKLFNKIRETTFGYYTLFFSIRGCRSIILKVGFIAKIIKCTMGLILETTIDSVVSFIFLNYFNAMNFKLLKEHLFITIFWVVLGITLWLNFQANDSKYDALIQTISILFFSIILTYFLTEKLLPKALQKKKMKQFLILSIFFILTLSILNSLVFTYISVNSKEPLSTQFSDHIPILWKGFYLSIPASLLIIGTACGIRFYQEHGKIERDHILLQQDHLENQLKLLQDQVNPHVMFNILNHIHILLKKDTELASFLLLKFSDILRYQLYECNKNEVILENEIQYLKDLIDVEKLRWGNEIDVSTSFTIMNKKAMIAPLLLVPFIENAFKHVSRVPDYKGFIKINCSENNNQIYLSIENTYAKIPIQSKNIGGIGLQNVKKRLNLIYPSAHELNITENGHLYKIDLIINLTSK